MPFLPLSSICVILTKFPFSYVLSFSCPSLPLKSIVFILALLISWKQAIYFCKTDICLFLSLLQCDPLLFPHLLSLLSYLPPFLLHILPFHILCARGDCNVCQRAPTLSKSLLPILSSSLLVPWIEVLVPPPSGWGEQQGAEYPGNDQWAVSQILGDYQCTE